MHNRLKQFLAAENVTQAQFASTIGIGKANISHVLSGRNKPGYDFIKAIMVGYPHLNINWLMVGAGKMYNMGQTPKERPVPEGTLIFENEDLPLYEDEDPIEEITLEPIQEEEIHVAPVVQETPAALSSSFTESTKGTQTPVHQRKISKIIVLFDDGTFQEM
jgi:transcriptional regulator with XRE-family HTH domain